MFKERIYNVLLAIVAAFAIVAFASTVAAEEKKEGGKKRKETVTYAAVLPNGVVNLHTEPCVSKKVTVYIPPVYLPAFAAGSIHMSGSRYEMCWTKPEPQLVVIVVEDGSEGIIPWGMFRAVSAS